MEESEGFEKGGPAREQRRGGAGRGGECGLVARPGRAGGALAPALCRQHCEDKRPADCSRQLSVGETAAVGRRLGLGRGSDGKGAQTRQGA